MENKGLFLSLYNELDFLLRERYNNNDRNSSAVLSFINELNHSSSEKLNKTGRKLNQIRVLRNNIVHEFDNSEDSLIDINNSTISFMKELVQELKYPKKAKDICVDISKAYTVYFDNNQPISLIMKEMRNKGFSQLPIINYQKLLKGVFSPNALFAYINEHPDININELTFADIKDYTLIEKHFSETYAFVDENMNIEQLADLFTNSYEKNKKLAMIFVTKSGRANEPVQGIIVAKDILLAE